MSIEAADLEYELLEALVSAIVSDTQISLTDPKNAFTPTSDDDECKCYHNMNVVLSMIKTTPYEAKHFALLIKSHIQDKSCDHLWHHRTILKALQKYNKPREF